MNKEKQMQPIVRGKAQTIEGASQTALKIYRNSPLVALRPMLRPTCEALPRSSCCYKTCTGKPKIVIYTEALEGTGLNKNPATSAQ
jgi:hypothetical protein